MQMNTDDVIRYLVAAFREELEDDGDLVAMKFVEAVNEPALIKYDPVNDKIVVEEGKDMVMNSLSDEAKAILGIL